MGKRCRDCPRCTEAVFFSLVFLPFRIVRELCLFWNIRLLQRKCPECKHLLKLHHRLSGGRFAD